VLDGITNCNAESEQQDLTASKEHGAEDDVADWPSILKGAEDKDELGNDVDGDTDERPDEIDDEKCDWFCVVKSEFLLEGGDGYKE